MPRTNPAAGLLLGLLAVTIFGGSLPATRAAVAGGLDPWFVTAARAAIGGVIGLAILAVVRPPLPRGRFASLTMVSALLVVVFPAAIAFASVSVPAAHGGVVLGLLPLGTAIAAAAIAHERPSAYFWLLSLVGAALVVAFALRDGDVGLAVGDLFLIVAITATGIGYTIAALQSRALPSWQVIAWALVISLPPALLACLLLWPPDMAAIPASAWIGLAYSGVMTQFVAYAIWNAALALGGVARIGQLQLIQPFITFAIAAIFLGETVDTTMIAFAVAVAIVVALGRKAAIGVRVRSPARPPA